LFGIRILLVGLQPLLSDLLERSLRAQHDFRIFGRCSEKDAVELARETKPDVVILATSTPRAVPHRIFEAHPSAKILCIETGSGRTSLCELIGDPVPEELVDVIRTAVTRLPRCHDETVRP
jgi:DNA-binding NarL/FixJ family response regulator